MKISTKGRYALRVLLDLAIFSDGVTCISINEIAARQELSEKYLEQIVAKLSKAGFVESRRGSKGGYLLAKPKEDIILGDVLREMEGEIIPISCTRGGECCDREEWCAARDLWVEIRDVVSDVIDHKTLADLEEQQRISGVGHLEI